MRWQKGPPWLTGDNATSWEGSSPRRSPTVWKRRRLCSEVRASDSRSATDPPRVRKRIKILNGITALPFETQIEDSKKQKVNQVNAEISQAEALLRRMDLEARGLAPEDKTPLLAKLREYKVDLNSLKQKNRSNASSGGGDDLARAELGLGGDYTTSSQRERLLDSTASLERTGDRLKQSQQTLYETEELGTGILQDLHRQRETIVRSRNTLHTADDNISQSRRILGVMARRMVTNKMIMSGTILFLLATIFIIVYYRLK